MKMSKLFTILFLSLVLVSCGGGTTISKSRNSVSIKMDFESINRSGKAYGNGFMVGSTYVESVKIAYGTTGVDYQYIDATAAAKDGAEILIPNLRAGATYSFTISAVDYNNEILCTGNTDVAIVGNETTDAELSCNFSGGTAIELAALNLIKAAYSGTATYDTISQYVASDFGLMDGMTREEFITDMLTNDNEEYLFDSEVKPVNVIIPDADSLLARSPVADLGVHEIKIIYSDGSFEYVTAGIVQEDGVWKIKGNGRAHDVEIRHSYSKIYYLFPLMERIDFSGLSVWVDGERNASGINGFTLSGVGISNTYFTKYTNEDIWFGLFNPNLISNIDNIPQNFPIGEIAYNIVPYNTTAMPGNTDVTAYYSDSTSETYTVKGVGLGTEVPAYYFPTVNMDYDSNTNEYVFTITKPMDMYVSGMKMTLYANVNNSGLHMESKLSLANSTFRISADAEILSGNPSLAYLGLTVVDNDMREFTTYYTLGYLDEAVGTDLSKISFYNAAFDGTGLNGFYSYLEYFIDVNSNEYTYDKYTPAIDSSGTSIFGATLVIPNNRLTYSVSDNSELILTRLEQNSPPYAISLGYTGYSSYPNDPVPDKILKGDDGSIYLISHIDSDTTSQAGIVTVLKLNSEMNQILWMRDYHFDYYTIPRSFYRGAILVDNGGTESLVLMLDHDTRDIVMLNIDTSDGSLINGKVLGLPDDSSNKMILTGSMLYLKDVNKIALVGTIEEPESGAYRKRLAVIVLNTNFTFSSVTMSSTFDDFPEFRDIAVDANGNIYYAYQNPNGTYVAKFNAVMDVANETYSITSITNKSLAVATYMPEYYRANNIRMAVSNNNVFISHSAEDFDINTYQNLFEYTLVKLDNSLNMSSAIRMDGMGYAGGLIPGANGSVVITGDKIINIMPDMTIYGMTFKSVVSDVTLSNSALNIDTSFYSIGTFSSLSATPIYGEHSVSDANIQQRLVNLYKASMR